MALALEFRSLTAGIRKRILLGKAWINGAQASLDDAAAAAARLLARSRLPLVTGLRTDVAGVKAAIALARRVGGVVDHADSEVLYRAIEVVRAAGLFTAAPAEMRRRADRFLVVGADATETAPELFDFVVGGVRDLGRASSDGAGRKVVWLGGASDARLAGGNVPIELVACPGDGLSDAVGMIRAALGKRPTGDGPISADAAASIAASLAAGSFVCVIWSAAALDSLGVDMAAGLVADLNLGTRASSISLTGSGQAFGAAQIATSVTGFPLRSRFGRGDGAGAGGDGGWTHDAWANDGARLIASGETDVVVHVSALAGGGSLALPEGIASIIVATGEMPAGAAVAFEVGVCGRDHAGVLFRDEAASFVPIGAGGAGGGSGVSAADVLRAIADAYGATPPEREA